MERDIVKRIEDLMDLFDEGEVTTADQTQRPEDPYRDFNERNPVNKADGGRIGFSNGPPGEISPRSEMIITKRKNKLQEVINKFKKENDGKLPSQNEIIKKTGFSSKTIQENLEEGVDYAKRLSKKEAARLGGRPLPKHIIKADDTKGLKELQNKINKLNRVNKLDGKGVRFVISKTQAGNFTPTLRYTAEAYGIKDSSGPIED